MHFVIDEDVLKEEKHGFSDGTRTGYVAVNHVKEMIEDLEAKTGKVAEIVKV